MSRWLPWIFGNFRKKKKFKLIFGRALQTLFRLYYHAGRTTNRAAKVAQLSPPSPDFRPRRPTLALLFPPEEGRMSPEEGEVRPTMAGDVCLPQCNFRQKLEWKISEMKSPKNNQNHIEHDTSRSWFIWQPAITKNKENFKRTNWHLHCCFVFF